MWQKDLVKALISQGRNVSFQDEIIAWSDFVRREIVRYERIRKFIYWILVLAVSGVVVDVFFLLLFTGFGQKQIVDKEIIACIVNAFYGLTMVIVFDSALLYWFAFPTIDRYNKLRIRIYNFRKDYDKVSTKKGTDHSTWRQSFYDIVKDYPDLFTNEALLTNLNKK